MRLSRSQFVSLQWPASCPVQVLAEKAKTPQKFLQVGMLASKERRTKESNAGRQNEGLSYMFGSNCFQVTSDWQGMEQRIHGWESLNPDDPWSGKRIKIPEFGCHYLFITLLSERHQDCQLILKTFVSPGSQVKLTTRRHHMTDFIIIDTAQTWVAR